MIRTKLASPQQPNMVSKIVYSSIKIFKAINKTIDGREKVKAGLLQKILTSQESEQSE